MPYIMTFSIATLIAVAVACGGQNRDVAQSGVGKTAAVNAQPLLPRAPEPVLTELTADEKRFYREMAKKALAYLNAQYQSASGLVSATPDWHYTTMWDIGGQILGYYSARQLGILTDAEYQRRMSKTLDMLEKMPLYNKVVFSRLYSTKDATISNTVGPGWTATDLGRFLIALKILAARDPKFAAQAERIARRNDFRLIVKDGYLYGEEEGRDGKQSTYQEGRIGYEQYVAAGFGLWGANVGNALAFRKNARPVQVMGVTLLADSRGQDRLLSEPFILQGIELGLAADMRDFANSVLEVQKARFKSTGQITMASEDAVAQPPSYFYYYCVYCNGKPFVIDLAAPGQDLDSPRWVSTKATFGWHALIPSDYTQKAIDYVRPAFDPKRGWASGVFEGSRASTKTYDVNTAAVLLEIALYQLRGRRPLIEAASIR